MKRHQPKTRVIYCLGVSQVGIVGINLNLALLWDVTLLGLFSLPTKIYGASSQCVSLHTVVSSMCSYTKDVILCTHTKDDVPVRSQVQARKGEGPLVQSFRVGGPIPCLSPPCTAFYSLHSSSFQPHLPPGQLKFFMCFPFWALCHVLDLAAEDFSLFTASSARQYTRCLLRSVRHLGVLKLGQFTLLSLPPSEILNPLFV